MQQLKCDSCDKTVNQFDGFSGNGWLRVTAQLDTTSYQSMHQRTLLDFCTYSCLKRYVNGRINEI